MGFFDDLLWGGGDPIAGGVAQDILGVNKKKKKPLGKKAQKKIDLYNQFIRAGVDLREELQPRLLGLERAAQTDSADLLTSLYEDKIGPASNRLSAEAASFQRGADLGDLERFGADWMRATAAAEEGDPRVAQQRQYEDELLKEAMRQFGLGSELDPVDLRRVQQQVRSNRSSVGFGTGENDLFQEAVALATRGEDLRRTRMGDAAGLLATLRRPMADVNQAILGRPSVALPFAQNAASQAGTRLSPYNAIEPTYGSDLLNAHYADLFSKRNKAAADKAADYQLYGSIIGAVGSTGGSAAGMALCWVAREVFGADDVRWMLFREWLVQLAPDWFVRWYLHNGERFAVWLRGKTKLKAIIRWWMIGRIRVYLVWAKRQARMNLKPI